MLSERRSGLSESLWRAGFGLWLLVQFTLGAWPGGSAMQCFGALGMLASLCVAFGWRDRPAALLLALLWRLGPLESAPAPGAWIVLLLLVLQFCLPPAPHGSLAAWGRTDPGGQWSMPNWILRLRFAALCACGAYVLVPRGALEPRSALTLAALAAGLFALAMQERALGWAWLALLVASVLASPESCQDGSRELLWLALAASFQPGWFPPLCAAGIDTIFYDGTCALCHGFVRFVLAEDARGESFRFAPLESGTQPDSIVVRTAEGRTLVRSRAVLHVLRRLGGWWRLAAEILRVVPPPLGDLAYSGAAALRKRLFGTKPEACPMLPRHLRARFES